MDGAERSEGNNDSATPASAPAETKTKTETKSEKDAASKPESDIKPNSSTNKAILENPNIDNPYLRAATLPKKSKHAN